MIAVHPCGVIVKDHSPRFFGLVEGKATQPDGISRRAGQSEIGSLGLRLGDFRGMRGIGF
jgi:hypothetical protein